MAGKLSYYQAKVEIDGDREIVRFMRKLPPAHYIIKIESFSDLLKKLKQTKVDKYQCAEFSAGGYKCFMLLYLSASRLLSIYPEGNKKDNGEGHISMYLKMVDKLEATVMVNTSLKFFILDQKRAKYLTISDLKKKQFHALKTEWGVPRLLPQSDFNDVSNGFLTDDACVFGVEASVVSKTTFENCGTSLLSTVKGSDLLEELTTNTYTWKITEFSKLKNEIYYSPVFTIKGYDWKLKLYPRGDVGQRDKNLSIFLCANDISEVTTGAKKLATKYVICLKNQLEAKDVEKNGASGFCNSNSGWGFSGFVPLEKVDDPSAGFKVDDSLIIQVTIEAIILVNI